MAYHIMCLEPGKKVAKMWAGKGNLTTKRIHAVQYPNDKYDYLVDWVAELNRDNPDFSFSLRKLTGGASIFTEDAG